MIMSTTPNLLCFQTEMIKINKKAQLEPNSMHYMFRISNRYENREQKFKVI